MHLLPLIQAIPCPTHLRPARKLMLRVRNTRGIRRFSPWKTACAAFLLCAATVIASPAQTFSTLFFFNGKDGSSPEWMTLIQGTDGNFYGTTTQGGVQNNGAVFKMTPEGQLTRVYSFCAQTNCVDGRAPFLGLVQATDGAFYGTTFSGGTSPSCPGGCGTVFKITAGGKLTTLHSFSSIDGARPRSALVQATNGILYGTASTGGAYNSGTVFQITTGGNLTTLYSFCAQTNCPDGLYPIAGLVQGTDGNFYGTTGGSDNLGGTVFKITPAGTLTTLYTFCAILDSTCTTAAYPDAGVVQGTDGNFYGTTYYGGPNEFGTVFKITPKGTLTFLHTFVQTDGQYPIAGLVQGTDGNFYGTTEVGGLTFSGTVFKITPAGSLTTLHSLYCESLLCPDGANPYGGLLQSTNGVFYGTTAQFDGSVFSISVGLGPFVTPRPASGKAGTIVKILGTELTGTTSVTFNGTAAAFTVISPTEIKTTVPAGATTGKLRVTTPAGTLKSNVAFQVR